jgi:hypothetical protein
MAGRRDLGLRSTAIAVSLNQGFVRLSLQENKYLAKAV